MRITTAAAACAALAIAGCAGTDMPWDGPKAAATLRPTQGNAVTGDVTFTQRGGKVLVSGEVRGLTPNKEHGFHVHEKGDCGAPDAMSAGAHFNPKNAQHGNYAMSPHHAGDMPNLRADANGVARIAWEDDDLTVSLGPASVVGRAVIVHRDPDDYKTQPTGDSGPRLSCGVVAKS